MKILISSVAAGFVLFFQACTPARMALDDQNWDQPETLQVKGRQGMIIRQKLSFGDYHTVSVTRSWTKTSSAFAGWAWGRPGYEDDARIIGVEFEKTKQSVRFELADQKGNESSVFCMTRVNSKNFVLGNNPNSLLSVSLDLLGSGKASENLFWVKLYCKNQEAPWELVLDHDAAQRNRKSNSGVIAGPGETYYTIHPVYKMAKKNGQAHPVLFGSVGFEIRNKQGKPLAAVSLIDKGIVYLCQTSPEEKFLMANICTALLLKEAI